MELVQIPGALAAADTDPTRADMIEKGTGVPSFFPSNGGAGISTPTDLVALLLNAILIIAAFVAFFGILYGGFSYLTAGADAGGADKGKRMLFTSLAALVITAFSYILIKFVVEAMQGKIS